MKAFMNAVSHYFDELHWPSLHQSHLTLDDIQPILKTLSSDTAIDVSLVGHSYHGRPIHRICMGNGEKRIMGWTQMHGDEPTATAAVLDWFNLLASVPEHIAESTLFSQCRLCFIVMLNPDGAQARERRNAQSIDINRDARVLQSPEGMLLMQEVKRFAPDIAFNLHDQNPYYLAGDNHVHKRASTMAFFAPPFDAQRTTDIKRQRAKQLIADIQQMLTSYFDVAIARYVDGFSARCFGDTIAGMCSTILIESGARHDDPCRHTARKMNVMALHYATLAVVMNKPLAAVSGYYDIPENIEDGMCDVLLRHVKLGKPEHHYFADISINILQEGACITDIGDLAAHAGFTEKACDGWRLLPDNPYRVSQSLTLTTSRYRALLLQGYNRFIDSDHKLTIQTSLPVVVDTWSNTGIYSPAVVGSRPALLLTQDQAPGLAIIDGVFIDL
ncbi:hypothetical protein HHX48_13450 [Salinimonas sp. HHU 13199]|uniref:Peptidase M14 domain-containing protein n=1 Tax=Salinimonas profundi TaxID=2729140 RepID=A0ABR8LME8_9ALTE|nr:M14 family zinc carboxypeptidase [Salinimonas profundi]MBD3586748.1 hypothetical protein [Salinimonas profundi]